MNETKTFVGVLTYSNVALPVLAMKVIMVTDVGGLGDKSFNDGTWEGIVKGL